MKKKRNKSITAKQTTVSGARSPKAWEIPGGEKTLLALLFSMAFIVRLIYLIQISGAPYFDSPIGDSQIYFSRAQEILAGNFLGDAIPFHSSPFYPLFMALILGISGQNFFILRLVQIIIGSANCVLIYGLTKKLAPGNPVPALFAGLAAAGYGLLAFFDGDLLMISLTLFFVDLALLLLIKAKETSKTRWACLAGISFGLAALDKTNLLLFVPMAAWYLGNSLTFKFKRWAAWKPAMGFSLGILLMILPVTIKNYIAEHDLVLVSSNAGVNLFIGNNPQAKGMFQLPPGSGLSNLDLQASSVARAEKETGRHLKPSEVSRFWAGKAGRFIKQHPLAAVRLYGQKIRLLWNHIEIPNHLNFEYIRAEFVPVFKCLFVGFWLIAPLAIIGIIGRVKQGLSLTGKLYLSFLAAYMISLLPFFITSRYRLPMVPVLIAFASVAGVEMFRSLRARDWKTLGWLSIALMGSFFWVNSNPHLRMTYSHNRVAIAGKYMERALQQPEHGTQDIQKAIVELKRALETEPLSEDANYNLGRAYEIIGFYSGAIQRLEKTLRINPERTSAVEALGKIREKYTQTGDMLSASALPKTLFEKAKVWEADKEYTLATNLYNRIIRENPYHLQAYTQLGLFYYEHKQYQPAIKLFRQALKISPNNFFLLNNLAGAHYRWGKIKQAKRIYQKCLKLQPESELVLRQLKTIEGI
ncbi:tetratricopeptide repeat protein [bacterium]|nr:tetratricopeptide repeat protein [bacterium]